MIPYIITVDSNSSLIVTLVLDNKPYTINSGHFNYHEIINELKGDQSVDKLKQLLNIQEIITNYIGNSSEYLEFDFQNSQILYKGQSVNTVLTDRIFQMMHMGFDINPMVKFMTNLYDNPSDKAINELYSFIEYGKLPITDDGHFLAYKRVNNDYTSVHDSKTDNSIGTIVTMPRENVDSDSNTTCSSGLHLCSFEYLEHFGGSRIVIVKVNPRDVVSIPTDYKNTKARACKYEIVGEVTDELNKEFKPVLPEVLARVSEAKSALEEAIQVYKDEERRHYEDYEDCYDDEDDYSDEDDYVEETPTPSIPYHLEPIYNTLKTLISQCTDFKRIGYDIGYMIGNKRLDKVTVMKLILDNVFTSADNMTTMLHGFNSGFSDGKGHKKRQYKKL